MPNHDASMAKRSEARFYGSLILLQGYYRQCPPAPDLQEIFTITTPGGLYTPTRVPQGIMKATSYFQATLVRVQEGLNCMVWLDDVIYSGMDEADLLNTLDLVLERIEKVGLYAAAHKCTFSRLTSQSVGKCTRRRKSSMILSGWSAGFMTELAAHAFTANV